MGETANYTVPHTDSDIPLTVLLVRHGEAVKQTDTDELGPPLTERGGRQAARAGKRLADETFDHIYTSDLRRARETAQAIRRYHKDTPCTSTADLREVSHHHFATPAEPVSDKEAKHLALEHRVIQEFVNFLRRVHRPGKKILLVCHGNIIRCLIAMLGDKDPTRSALIDIGNTALSIVEIWPNNVAVLKLANCLRHVPPKQIS